jgi:DNA-directed RNA polymerase subunit M/transcription elongation factor TFIIS
MPAKGNQPPASSKTPLPKCKRCESPQISIMGRMEQSKDTLYQCGQCGFVFTTT